MAKNKKKNKKRKIVILKKSAKGGSAFGGKKTSRKFAPAKKTKNSKQKKSVIRKKIRNISLKKKNKKIVQKKKNKKRKIQKKSTTLLSLGNIQPSRGRILALAVSIIFMLTGMVFTNVFKTEDAPVGQVAGVSAEAMKKTELEKGIRKMVQGYPIEKMTPYIAKKDPQTAAFLVAIAKKESNWGKRRPVLNGEDCFNYWGFRLKAERMGSGGHTCFDSPQQAVDMVAERLDELVQEEKITSPNEMVIWKCGYGCQDEEKSKSELKWIKDVAYYYNELERYL